MAPWTSLLLLLLMEARGWLVGSTVVDVLSVSIVPEAPIEIVAVLYSKLGEYITAICADQVCARLSFELAH